MTAAAPSQLPDHSVSPPGSPSPGSSQCYLLARGVQTEAQGTCHRPRRHRRLPQCLPVFIHTISVLTEVDSNSERWQGLFQPQPAVSHLPGAAGSPASISIPQHKGPRSQGRPCPCRHDVPQVPGMCHRTAIPVASQAGQSWDSIPATPVDACTSPLPTPPH